MVFDILIRIKTNRAEYIECPIVPVVEQTLHGTHGWRWGNKPHDSSCGVRFVATLLPTSLRSTSVASYRLFYSTRRAVTPEALQSGRGDPCGRPCFPSANIALGIWFKIIFFWGHPKPRARGIRPLRIPDYAGISYPSFIVKDHKQNSETRKIYQ